MATGERPWDLCMTCNSSATCSRRNGNRLPILYCEEFDGWLPPDLENEPPPVVADPPDALDTAMGLCCNCENRDSCTLQATPGGVWHCEEYR